MGLPRSLLAFTLVVLALWPFASSDPGGLLLRAAWADEAERWRAVAAWEALPEELKFRALRSGLQSEDEAVAVFAAERLDPFRMSLGELRRAGTVVARHPERYFGPTGDLNRLPRCLLGIEEVAHLWRGVVACGIDVQPMDSLVTHRPTVPEHLPDLVALLPRSRPATFRWLAKILANAAEGIERHREVVARGLLYVLARLDAEAEGREPPALESIETGGDSPGLPEGFVTLASAAWRLDDRSEARRGELRSCLPDRWWLVRWARGLTPSAEDLPFLRRAARNAPWTMQRVVAIRLAGRLDSPEATRLLEELAAENVLTAYFAAAELARRGRPERFLQLLAQETEITGTTQMLACEAVPDFVLARLREGNEDWSVGFLADAHEWSEFESLYGVPRPDGLIARFVRETLADPSGDPQEVYSLLVHYPWLLTEAAEDWLLERLREWRPPAEYFWPVPDASVPPLEQDPYGIGYDLLQALGVLEVRQPERLRSLLQAWKDGESEFLCGVARILLARLDHPAGLDPVLLRRVSWREPKHGEEVGEPWVTFRKLRGKDQLRDGILYLAEQDPEILGEDLVFLALYPDARVLALLERLRSERRLYWPATFALAVAGNVEARAEALGFVRDGRTWMFDRLDEPTALSCAADPEFVEHWIDRLEACCCQAWPSCVVLGRTFPVLDVPEIVRGHMATQRRVGKILGPARGRYVRSRILGAWIPLR